jgi:acyl-coenzyme A thioesterase PaaI-like protein
MKAGKGILLLIAFAGAGALGANLVYAAVKPQQNTGLAAIIVESNLLAHPLVRRLKADPSFHMSRPHMQFPPLMAQLSFTASMIGMPGKVAVPPVVWTKEDGSEGIAIMYLGNAMCGHPGFVHGGMIATILDEGLARTCFNALPNKVGMTANLTIDYRKPCKSNQFVVLKAKTTKVDGRKAWVEGRLETLPEDGSEGELIAEGKALFVEPRNAAVAKNLMRVTGVEQKTNMPASTLIGGPYDIPGKPSKAP